MVQVASVRVTDEDIDVEQQLGTAVCVRSTSRALHRFLAVTHARALFAWEDGRPRLVARGGSAAMEQLVVLTRRGSNVRKQLTANRPARMGVELFVPIHLEGSLVGVLVLPDSGRWPLGTLSLIATQLFERLRLERELRQHAGSALKRRSAKSRLRHDLLSPITGIKGYVEMISRGMAGPLSPNLERYVTRIMDALGRQQSLIQGRLSSTPR